MKIASFCRHDGCRDRSGGRVVVDVAGGQIVSDLCQEHGAQIVKAHRDLGQEARFVPDPHAIATVKVDCPTCNGRGWIESEKKGGS